MWPATSLCANQGKRPQLVISCPLSLHSGLKEPPCPPSISSYFHYRAHVFQLWCRQSHFLADSFHFISELIFRTVQNEVPPPQIDSHSHRPIFGWITFYVFDNALKIKMEGKKDPLTVFCSVALSVLNYPSSYLACSTVYTLEQTVLFFWY